MTPALTVVYDADGNTTSSAGIANTYDFENRMLSHGAVTLVYDGAGGPGFELPTRSIRVGAPSLCCWQGRV
jgi:hypothetical protein